MELSKTVKKGKARVADLCCGVGISTRALNNAFPDADVTGVDTSPEMVAMAVFLAKHLKTGKSLLMNNATKACKAVKKQGSKIKSAVESNGNCLMGQLSFKKANAEDTRLPGRSFDLVTVMYAFHEAPAQGRDKIIKEARRLLQPGGTLAVVDISADYTPSKSMLAGEPYVKEYQQNIHRQLKKFKGFARSKYKIVVPGHVGMWTLKRSSTSFA